MVTESVKKQNLVKANERQKLSTTFPPCFTQVMRARVYMILYFCLITDVRGQYLCIEQL